MTDGDTGPAVACTMTEADAERRSDRVIGTMEATFRSATELEDGFALAFDGTDDPLHALAAFVANEHDCCAFADYEIVVSPPYDETTLTITGPDGTKATFRSGLVERLEAKP